MWTIQSKNSKNYLHWRAFTKQELLKDKTIENSQTVLKQLSKTYSINFLTARGFNGFKNFRFFPEVLYKSKFGQHFLRMNNLSSKIFNKIGLNPKKYAYDITYKWLIQNNYSFDRLIVVDTPLDKVNFLRINSCDLFIDDMSHNHENSLPYTNLYDKEINMIKRLGINFELFDSDKNNWNTILSKYL
jgi:uncharacterized HAD superfamily protein